MIRPVSATPSAAARRVDAPPRVRRSHRRRLEELGAVANLLALIEPATKSADVEVLQPAIEVCADRYVAGFPGERSHDPATGRWILPHVIDGVSRTDEEDIERPIDIASDRDLVHAAG